MREFEGALRLLGCICADTAEDFYKFYPGAKARRKNGKDDYFNRLLRADKEKFEEYRRHKNEQMREYRRRKGN